MSAATRKQTEVTACVGLGNSAADCAAAAQSCGDKGPATPACVRDAAQKLGQDTGTFTTACTQGGRSAADCQKTVQECLGQSNPDACMSTATAQQTQVNTCVSRGHDAAACTAAVQTCKGSGGGCVDQQASQQQAETTLTTACEQAGGNKTTCTQAAQVCVANGNSTDACVSNVASSLASSGDEESRQMGVR
jgi:hypothetical protein